MSFLFLLLWTLKIKVFKTIFYFFLIIFFSRWWNNLNIPLNIPAKYWIFGRKVEGKMFYEEGVQRYCFVCFLNGKRTKVKFKEKRWIRVNGNEMISKEEVFMMLLSFQKKGCYMLVLCTRSSEIELMWFSQTKVKRSVLKIVIIIFNIMKLRDSDDELRWQYVKIVRWVVIVIRQELQKVLRMKGCEGWRQSQVQITSQYMMDFLEEISSFKVIQWAFSLLKKEENSNKFYFKESLDSNDQ
jgi:hypothetical protein